ncbi:hypothetical protein EDB92DRAFT_688839 [Lactarius akahatsu]|uniref:Uncharacterized protein n=1 Tax=Lactarius akahatsu TaxID=416441 RepID=A0AAD4LL71_9AGAM|nr:hypothetical protein EDB92DRAFT_688839 [Lactarius akahatsu]
MTRYNDNSMRVSLSATRSLRHYMRKCKPSLRLCASVIRTRYSRLRTRSQRVVLTLSAPIMTIPFSARSASCVLPVLLQTQQRTVTLTTSFGSRLSLPAGSTNALWQLSSGFCEDGIGTTPSSRDSYVYHRPLVGCTRRRVPLWQIDSYSGSQANSAAVPDPGGPIDVYRIDEADVTTNHGSNVT